MPRFQHPLEIHGFNEMVEAGLDVEDLEVKDLLILVLAELRATNEHLAIITGEEIRADETLEV